MTERYLTERELRVAFWLTWYVEGKPRRFYGKSHNELPADIRMAFCEYVDYAERNGTISARTAQNATLG